MRHLSLVSPSFPNSDAGVHTLPVNAGGRDTASLRHQLSAMYADPSASVSDTSDALVELLWRKCGDEGPECLTEHDRTCLHVYVFDADLCTDGFALWIRNGCNGYGFPVTDTLQSLERIGAPWAAKLGALAIRTVPARAREALVAGHTPVLLGAFPRGPRREIRISALDSAYQRRRTRLEPDGGIEGLIVRYARQHHVCVSR
jgi:hypothetical protein